jgi:hypothetical protein
MKELTIPAIIIFAVSWGIYTSKSSAQEKRIENLEIKYETILEMKTDIAVIKNNVEFMKVALEKHLEE